MTEILKYDSVEISYGSTVCVHGISLALRRSEILSIVGESGSGKTTILRAALRLPGKARVTGGQILYRGQNTGIMSEKELQDIRGARIGMIFQDSAASFCPVRTLGSQIHEALRSHRDITLKGSRKMAFEAFSKLGLEDGDRIWDSYPFQLSGGMCARAAIAVAVLQGPEVLLADEPTGSLDAVSRKEVVRELLTLRDIFGTSVIIVTHDMRTAACTDSILVLKNGMIIERGTAQEILSSPTEQYTKDLLRAVPHIRKC